MQATGTTAHLLTPSIISTKLYVSGVILRGNDDIPALVLCLVAQLCPTLCNAMDCNLPGSSVNGDSPGKNTELGCHILLHRIFPTQGSNPGLPYCRQILYHLSFSESQVAHILHQIEPTLTSRLEQLRSSE